MGPPKNCLFISNCTVATGITFRGFPCTDKKTAARSSARVAGQCPYLCLFTLVLFTRLKLRSEVRKLISPTQCQQSHKRAYFVQESSVYGDKAKVASENDTKNDTQAAQSMLKSMLKTDLQQFPLSLQCISFSKQGQFQFLLPDTTRNSMPIFSLWEYRIITQMDNPTYLFCKILWADTLVWECYMLPPIPIAH